MSSELASQLAGRNSSAEDEEPDQVLRRWSAETTKEEVERRDRRTRDQLTKLILFGGGRRVVRVVRAKPEKSWESNESRRPMKQDWRKGNNNLKASRAAFNRRSAGWRARTRANVCSVSPFAPRTPATDARTLRTVGRRAPSQVLRRSSSRSWPTLDERRARTQALVCAQQKSMKRRVALPASAYRLARRAKVSLPRRNALFFVGPSRSSPVLDTVTKTMCSLRLYSCSQAVCFFDPLSCDSLPNSIYTALA